MQFNKRIMNDGWYRIYHGWWHPDLGDEPKKRHAKGSRLAGQMLKAKEETGRPYSDWPVK